jgi:hypothetical protein
VPFTSNPLKVVPVKVFPAAANVYPAFVPLLKAGSRIQAEAEVATHGEAIPPRLVKSTAYPVPQVEAYVVSAVVIVRIPLTADASFAAIFERSKLGTAMAAMIKIIATTISNSISEKPRCLFIKSPAQCVSYLALVQRRLYHGQEHEGCQLTLPSLHRPWFQTAWNFSNGPIRNPFLRRLKKKRRKQNFLPFTQI